MAGHPLPAIIHHRHPFAWLLPSTFTFFYFLNDTVCMRQSLTSMASSPTNTTITKPCHPHHKSSPCTFTSPSANLLTISSITHHH
jgi:hypothetical protein